MAGKKVALACSECGARNYMVAKKPDRAVRLEMMKYCKFCDKHTMHRETI